MKKRILLLIVPVMMLASPFHTKEQIKEISASVVKIYTTAVKPDYYRPWQKGHKYSASGTGVIIEGRQILTAAHVVSNAAFLQVKKGNEAKKHIAKVKWIAHEADLALLEVEDEHFYAGTAPQPFGKLPYRQDGVVVYGYPMGGDEISTTKGIVSRIEQTVYAHSYMDNLTVQIDAAINHGNSGGPAFDKEGNIVGIAIQALSGASGIGYLVPVPVIEHFLKDIEDGTYDGYPDDGTRIQNIENEHMRAYYGLKTEDGVLVQYIEKDSSADGILKKGDAVLEIDGIDVAGDNTVKIEGNNRVSSSYLIRKHQVGDSLRMKIMRDKKEMNVSFPLKARRSIVTFEHEKEPRYYIFGGMSFMPLTTNFLLNWGENWYAHAPVNLFYPVLNRHKIDRDITEMIVLNTILPNNENANYTFGHEIVSKINGHKVTSLNALVKLIEKSGTNYIVITFDSGREAVLNRAEAEKTDRETLKQYGIERKQRL